MSNQPTTLPDGNSLSIFCVDDARCVLQILRLAFEVEQDISVRVASRSDEALRALIDPDYQPDCILLDMIMPEVDGKMLLGEIRALAHHRATPVIFLTASAQPADIQGYRELGACGMIAKPFDPLTLATQVRAMLARHCQTKCTVRWERTDSE